MHIEIGIPVELQDASRSWLTISDLELLLNALVMRNVMRFSSLSYLNAGRTRIKLRKSGETYSLVPPNSKAHNVIVGGTWVDCYGNFKLSNVSTGTQCSLYFTPCGWFGNGRYEVRSLSSHLYCSILTVTSQDSWFFSDEEY